MSSLILKLFIKDKDFQNEKTHEKVGFVSSCVGIVCNVFLFALKLLLGIMSGSITIISDAFNNLSDSATNIITLFGYKMAAKPADKEHPFGHGRIEYLISLVIAIVILFVSYELFKNSIDKIMNPNKVIFSWGIFISLGLSILIKFWMSSFYKKMGNLINSSILFAVSKDSLNDTISTGVSLIALCSSQFTTLPIDGVLGCFVSLFVFYSGYGIIKQTVDELLGKPADQKMINEIQELIMSHDGMIGVHDLIIHDYGPGKLLGSAHVEIDARRDILEVHDSVDHIERELYERLHIMMTIHMDPIDLTDEKVKVNRMMIEEILVSISSELCFHDFRMVTGPTHTNLIFDVVVPYGLKMTDQMIQERINEALLNKETKFYTVITFDRNY